MREIRGDSRKRNREPNGDSHHDGTSRNENWRRAYPRGCGRRDNPDRGRHRGKHTPRTAQASYHRQHRRKLRHHAGRAQPLCYLCSPAEGSITVRVHDQVKRGTVIGRLGNSGKATARRISIVSSPKATHSWNRKVFHLSSADSSTSDLARSLKVDKHPSIRWDAIDARVQRGRSLSSAYPTSFADPSIARPQCASSTPREMRECAVPRRLPTWIIDKH